MNERARLAVAYLTLQPDAGAKALESLPPATAAEVLRLAGGALTAALLARMLPTAAARCVERLPVDAAAAALTELPVPDAAAIARHLPPPARDAVLAALGTQRLMAFKLLLSYPPHTVGAWMDVTAPTLPIDCDTVGARERLGESRIAPQTVFVLDRARRVRGAVATLALLRDTGGPRALEALVESTETLWAREPLASAQDRSVWERRPDAPIVNRDGQYVGVLSYADLRRAQKQLAPQRDGIPHPTSGGSLATAEVAELMAVGASTVWQELTELVSNGRPR